MDIAFYTIFTYNECGVGGISMSSHDENVVTHNPFEGKNGASMRNQAIDAGIGFGASFVFFAIMFIIAIIIDVAA